MFHGELLARASAYEAEVAAALDGWRRERRSRWDTVRARVAALTLQTRMSLEESRRLAAATGSGRRDQVGEVLRMVLAMGRERQRLEDEIWAQLKAARADDLRWRAAVARGASGLGELGRRLAREMDGAVVDATAAGTARVADTPAGKALVSELGRARALLARRLEEVGTGIEAGLGRIAGRAFPDMSDVLRRFDEAMAGRLGGDGTAAPVRVRAAPVRRPAGPPRKKARVPKFVLAKFYREGGLRAAGDGVEITFHNPLAFCIIQAGDAVLVNGRPWPKGDTVLDNGERRVSGVELSETSYLKFAKGGEIRVTLRGLALPPGQHRFMCALELRKMGWVELSVQDQVSP